MSSPGLCRVTLPDQPITVGDLLPVVCDRPEQFANATADLLTVEIETGSSDLKLGLVKVDSQPIQIDDRSFTFFSTSYRVGRYAIEGASVRLKTNDSSGLESEPIPIELTEITVESVLPKEAIQPPEPFPLQAIWMPAPPMALQMGLAVSFVLALFVLAAGIRRKKRLANFKAWLAERQFGPNERDRFLRGLRDMRQKAQKTTGTDFRPKQHLQSLICEFASARCGRDLRSGPIHKVFVAMARTLRPVTEAQWGSYDNLVRLQNQLIAEIKGGEETFNGEIVERQLSLAQSWVGEFGKCDLEFGLGHSGQRPPQ